MYFIYIIQSYVDSSFYIGYTSYLDRRIQQHNKGLSKYTSTKKPWKLVYSEEFITKTEAIKKEKFLKNQKSRYFYNKLIKSVNKLSP